MQIPKFFVRSSTVGAGEGEGRGRSISVLDCVLVLGRGRIGGLCGLLELVVVVVKLQ